MGTEEQNDLGVSQCGTIQDQSNAGTVNNDMLDINPENANLEEALERIIMLADDISEKAQSTTENLAEDLATKNHKGKKNSKRSSVASLVLGRSCKRLRSSCTDKSSMLLHGQPRLSPLAARAALAATVTPLRKGNQANLVGNAQGIHSETCMAGTSFSKDAKNNDRNIHVKKGQNTRASLGQNHRTTLDCKRTNGPAVKETEIYTGKRKKAIKLLAR
ncbi:hypothetical protein L7F22_035061 [Adiantum nelumboides]|nr:hypothetical protein [Adiantum nelumboides]